MHPCSHPRYGFKLVSKPTSGLVLRVMIVLVPSRKYCVGRRGVSSVSQPTSTTSGSVKSTCSFSNRFAGLQDAPRPRRAALLCGASTAFFGVLLIARRRVGLACLPIPILIGFSRMYIGAHYLSDVVCAAVLGTFCALVVAYFLLLPIGNRQSKIEN